jgi:glycine cleavage system H protein
MTVVLVLATLLTFLVADYLVQRTRAARRMRVLQTAAGTALPAGTYLVANHTWTRHEPVGCTVIGLDELLAHALGTVEQIVLPATGDTVSPSTAGIGFSARGRALNLASPVEGNVVEINAAVVRDPSLARRDPYGAGWLMKIRPAAGAVCAAAGIESPAEWLRSQRELMKEFFLRVSAPPVALMMQDGGEPAEGVLQGFSAEVWAAFGSTFTTLPNEEPVTVPRQERRS